MAHITIGGIVKTSIVTAFTIAAALIWKDVITESIRRFFPSGDALYYEFLTAIIATVFVIIAIYVVLKTEAEAENIVRTIKNMNKTRRKRILKEIKKAEERQKLRKIEKKIGVKT
ncbi:hypothetical protein BMS3Abin17_00257 [archaeon BMS3Abin17]|nr:hypothetical protein BMS3Abin17_00257 [archaeon BMS3Abin17]HDZ60639.1 hypothetical protein [Candidatus Pacearchaeota archaeon]